MNEFRIKSIGKISIDKQGFIIEIDEEFRQGLLETEDFSHLLVLFWCHGMDNKESRNKLICNKPYKNAPEKVGVFATRSPERPNPIGLSPVQVIKMDKENGKIYIPFIDAENNTPVIDIKPYTPCIDRIRDLKTPSWNSHWPDYYEESGDFDWESEFVL